MLIGCLVLLYLNLQLDAVLLELGSLHAALSGYSSMPAFLPACSRLTCR